ncbi:MAG: hypothetical protein J0626_02635, partial [Rhodospirillaceae bacterium]|nr:hypothetical protein [Rhodospirillaceae bacterium]
MQNLLSRYSLRYQIGLLVALAGLVFALSAAIQMPAKHQASASLEAAATQRLLLDQATQVDMGLLQARRHEKNFLLRHDEASQREHAEAIQAMEKGLGGMAAALPSGQGDKQTQVATVRNAVTRYVAAFRGMVELQKKAGLGYSDGALGDMRDAARKMEDAVRQADQPRLLTQLLMMRSAEREFLAQRAAADRADWEARAAVFLQSVQSSDMA